MAETVLDRYGVSLYERKPTRHGGVQPLLYLMAGTTTVAFANRQEEEGPTIMLAELEAFVRRCHNSGRCEAQTRRGIQCQRHADVVIGFPLRCTQHGG